MKQLEVSIMGQSYILACPDGGEAVLTAAVRQVDREMCTIRDAGRVKARERIAVLAALNMAFELTEPQRTAAPADDAAAAASGDAPALSVAEQATLGALLGRLDEALGDDGRLL